MGMSSVELNLLDMPFRRKIRPFYSESLVLSARTSAFLVRSRFYPCSYVSRDVVFNQTMHRDVDVVRGLRTAIGRRRALRSHSASPDGIIRSFVESETRGGNRARENNRVPADLRKSEWKWDRVGLCHDSDLYHI